MPEVRIGPVLTHGRHDLMDIAYHVKSGRLGANQYDFGTGPLIGDLISVMIGASHPHASGYSAAGLRVRRRRDPGICGHKSAMPSALQGVWHVHRL
jgi:hypothetical protein